MYRTSSLLLAVGFTTALAASASASIHTAKYTDDSFESQLIPVNTPVAVAEGRWGSNTIGGATFELDLGPNTGAPATTAHYVWPDAAAVPFSLTWNDATDTLTFTVGPNQASLTQVLNYSTAGTFNTMFIRTRAQNVSSMKIDNLLLDAVAVGDQAYAIDTDTDATGVVDVLKITRDSGLIGGFTLTGSATFDWTGDGITSPYSVTNSKLAFQIKLGETSIPEPMSLSLLGLAAPMLLGRRRQA